MKKITSRAIPLWMVFIMLLYSILTTGLIEYYIMKRNFNAQVAELAKTTKSPEELVRILKQQVLPQKGYALSVRWKDIGK